MWTLRQRLAAAIAAAGVFLVVGEARAGDASCNELLAARDRGQSDTQIATTYRTTHARLEACEHIAKKRQELQERRIRFEDAHAERAWRAN